MGRNEVEWRYFYNVQHRLFWAPGAKLEDWVQDRQEERGHLADGGGPLWLRAADRFATWLLRRGGVRYQGTARQMRRTWVKAGEFWRLEPDDPLYEPRGPWDDKRLTADASHS